MAVNKVAYFFAGAVLGAAGMALVKTGKGQKLVSGMLHGGCGLAENILTRVETIKEDIEDYMAEVQYNKAEKAKAQTAEAQPAENVEEVSAEAEPKEVAESTQETGEKDESTSASTEADYVI